MSATTMLRPLILRCDLCGTRNRVDLSRLAHGPRCADCKRPMLLDRPHRISGDDLDETLRESAVPVLVDLYADWCGRCRAMAPVLDTFAANRAGELPVLKLDTDQYPGVAARLGIRGIPTLIVFEGGREVARHVGMADGPTLGRLAGLA
jgi:thioredoxin 2